ncbi:hypothetical protein T10_5198 [Trichinella papuae]|uniref:Uncharacterized protein n=1 Tax=Trichinella papuae TaxID=268474 RepID=A0A0V1M511_9BILA|nr:hypothetical protein T10_5198 [Trichinella papuae]
MVLSYAIDTDNHSELTMWRHDRCAELVAVTVKKVFHGCGADTKHLENQLSHGCCYGQKIGSDNDNSARKSTNNYLCLFTCRVTRAVHLELVSKMAIGRLLQASYILHSSAPPSSLNSDVRGTTSASTASNGSWSVTESGGGFIAKCHGWATTGNASSARTFVRLTVHLHVPLNCSGYQGLTRLAGVLILESDNYQCFLWRDTDTDPQKC